MTHFLPLTPEKFRFTLLDLSAAFDTIDHTILLTRLEYSFGIHNTTLAWFKLYLYKQCLPKQMQSDPVKLSCNVPQGFILGPVPFTLYTTSLASIINHHNLNHHFYASDTQLPNSALPENIKTLLKTTSDCYSDIKNWMTHNKLRLNSDKTEAMLIGTRSKHIKGSKERCLSGQDTTCKFSGNPICQATKRYLNDS